MCSAYSSSGHRSISIYFTYGSAAAAILTRLCRPPARSYADNFRPTGNELNWKPRKRRGSGFVIYQTHTLSPNRFSRENELSTVQIIIIIIITTIRSNRITEGSSNVRLITLFFELFDGPNLFNLYLDI